MLQLVPMQQVHLDCIWIFTLASVVTQPTSEAPTQFWKFTTVVPNGVTNPKRNVNTILRS